MDIFIFSKLFPLKSLNILAFFSTIPGKPTNLSTSIRKNQRYSLPLCLLISCFSFTNNCFSEEKGFLATWKLLKSQEKQQFIAGYLHGWRDARKVTGVLLEHVEKNPKDAVASLKTIQKLYDISGETPSELAKGIDEFYSDPDNMDAVLSKAITASLTR